MSPKKVYYPARRTQKLWPDSLHHRPTLRSKPFWAWWDITNGLLRGLHYCATLHEYLSGEGASKKNKHVMLMKEVLGAFETLKKACLDIPILAFANFNKPFLLETDTSKLGLGLCYHRSRLMVSTIQWSM